MRIYYSCCLCKYFPSTPCWPVQRREQRRWGVPAGLRPQRSKCTLAMPEPCILLVGRHPSPAPPRPASPPHLLLGQHILPQRSQPLLSCDNATCPVYTSAALIPSFPPFPPQTPHNCVSPPHSQLIDTCATPFRAPDPAIMLTDTMMPLCRIVPASYQEYPKYMPGICSSTPDLFNAASSANLLLLLPL